MPVLDYGRPDPQPQASLFKASLTFAAVGWIAGLAGSLIAAAIFPPPAGEDEAPTVIIAIILGVFAVIAWVAVYLLINVLARWSWGANGLSTRRAIFGGAIYGVFPILGTIFEHTHIEAEMTIICWLGLLLFPVLVSFWIVRPASSSGWM